MYQEEDLRPLGSGAILYSAVDYTFYLVILFGTASSMDNETFYAFDDKLRSL